MHPVEAARAELNVLHPLESYDVVVGSTAFDPEAVLAQFFEALVSAVPLLRPHFRENCTKLEPVLTMLVYQHASHSLACPPRTSSCSDCPVEGLAGSVVPIA